MSPGASGTAAGNGFYVSGRPGTDCRESQECLLAAGGRPTGEVVGYRCLAVNAACDQSHRRDVRPLHQDAASIPSRDVGAWLLPRMRYKSMFRRLNFEGRT